MDAVIARDSVEHRLDEATSEQAGLLRFFRGS